MDKALASLDTFLKREIYRNHQDINAGGCCMFAALLARYLNKVGKARIRVSDWSTDDNAILKARKNVRRNTVHDWNDHGVGFNHVAIEFEYKGDKFHIDAQGITGTRRFEFLKGELLLKEATELGDCSKGWNRFFNRREIPAIKRRVQNYFKKHLKKTAKSVRLVA
jgi:hypothetical protein